MKSPLEKALKTLPQYYNVDPSYAKECMEWYFGASWQKQIPVSRELSSDFVDAVAWELHEIVEACEFRKRNPQLKTVNWRAKVFPSLKKEPHKRATEVELAFLKSVARHDLIEQVLKREKRRSIQA